MQFSIPRPPWTALPRHLESLCRKAILEFDLITEGETIAIALSGGKDSLGLLFLLHAINGRGVPSYNLIAVHVDGEFSCGAGVHKNFLQNVCNQLNIPLHIRTGTQKLETLACYPCSRERRTLIFNAAKEAGATTVAFGHHRDDNAQTLLMNLLHKGEFAGNLPKLHMVDYKITIIRPLIYASEKELSEMAQLHKYNRISCQCPVGAKSMRKKADLLLEEMELSFPNARENIASASLRYGSDKARK